MRSFKIVSGVERSGIPDTILNDIELAEKGSSGLGSGAFTYSAIVS
jgi:hypothetical protein